ncbi:hypothetical protein NDU88_000845 [Pleurodeles waltl]|uniref:Uncharacterized protein n=1 Tax=Pleurodeles waltl TaxID=8319 RepID=A0AAV7S8D5_PLEWA|nr:hypothetical protein NDU88_000845 [Pleurodeles waltl]
MAASAAFAGSSRIETVCNFPLALVIFSKTAWHRANSPPSSQYLSLRLAFEALSCRRCKGQGSAQVDIGPEKFHPRAPFVIKPSTAVREQPGSAPADPRGCSFQSWPRKQSTCKNKITRSARCAREASAPPTETCGIIGVPEGQARDAPAQAKWTSAASY